MPEFRSNLLRIAMTALVLQIPFELRYTLLGLSNLQWTFVFTALVASPLIFHNLTALLRDRLVQASIFFAATQWMAAYLAAEFNGNAYRAAARISAGVVLLAIVRSSVSRDLPWRTWSIAAGLAAVYALLAHVGWGIPSLFRNEEFFSDQIRRLSGSFEYPNTAAAYFALSLPVVWSTPLRRFWKWPLVFLLWIVLILTLSKGALVAVLLTGLLAGVLGNSRTPKGRSYVRFVAVGGACSLALLPAIPLLSQWLHTFEPGNRAAALYSTPWNLLQQQPDTEDVVPLQIRNTDVVPWSAEGASRVAVSYWWWSVETEAFIRKAPPPVVSVLPHDVSPGETVEVQATIRTPREPGSYILVLELFSRDFLWFSRTGLMPALLQAEIKAGNERQVTTSDLSTYYNWAQTKALRSGRPLAESLTASVPRSSLWRAALAMFTEHPLGVGPDNFRLKYGAYLGAANWNTEIHSNNLYLELLTGSGFLGLAAFTAMILVRPWSLSASSLGVTVFLIHGLVDVFLMATPIYFSFWLFLGSEPSRPPAADTAHLEPAR